MSAHFNTMVDRGSQYILINKLPIVDDDVNGRFDTRSGEWNAERVYEGLICHAVI